MFLKFQIFCIFEIFINDFFTVKSKPTEYIHITENKLHATFNKNSYYSECSCNSPCSIDNGCINALSRTECLPHSCQKKCFNQNFREGEKIPVGVRITELKGFGLFALVGIPAGKFVIEYMGEVIDKIELDQRLKNYRDNNFYFLALGQNKFIDAALYGNQSRFINHSCEPNLEMQKWAVYSNGVEQTRIGLFSLRKINQGEELSMSYNWNVKTTICNCEAKNCRHYI